MIDQPARVEQFKAEIAEMGLPDPATARDRLLLRGSAALMAVGAVVALVAYLIGHGTSNPLQQRDAVVLAVLGLVLAVIGSALFIRYSMAQFLRFWLARLSWEQQANTDRLIESFGNDGPP